MVSPKWNQNWITTEYLAAGISKDNEFFSIRYPATWLDRHLLKGWRPKGWWSRRRRRCADCQYLRLNMWPQPRCSNSLSPRFMHMVDTRQDSCAEFTRRGRKAHLVRILSVIVRLIGGLFHRPTWLRPAAEYQRQMREAQEEIEEGQP